MFAIQKSDMDLRKVLYQNIVLSGGSTLFRGFGDRLLSEIRRLAPKDMKLRVSLLWPFELSLDVRVYYRSVNFIDL